MGPCSGVVLWAQARSACECIFLLKDLLILSCPEKRVCFECTQAPFIVPRLHTAVPGGVRVPLGGENFEDIQAPAALGCS